VSRSGYLFWLRIAASFASAVVVLGGCESTEDPELTGLVSRDYVESIAVATVSDTVLVLVGTSEYQGADQPVDVFFDAQPSIDSSIRIAIRVVGLTQGSSRRAHVAHGWSGDTLRVWCGYDESTTLGSAARSSAADPWSPPWLIPKRVDISSPVGVVAHYLGPWYE
jgi:hypothetical protein